MSLHFGLEKRVYIKNILIQFLQLTAGTTLAMLLRGNFSLTKHFLYAHNAQVCAYIYFVTFFVDKALSTKFSTRWTFPWTNNPHWKAIRSKFITLLWEEAPNNFHGNTIIGRVYLLSAINLVAAPLCVEKKTKSRILFLRLCFVSFSIKSRPAALRRAHRGLKQQIHNGATSAVEQNRFRPKYEAPLRESVW
jgi:hypothetical protein